MAAQDSGLRAQQSQARDLGVRSGRPYPLLGAGIAIRVVIALVVGAGISAGVWKLFPAHLASALNVVGYPAFADFNIEGVLRDYDIAVVVFPLVAVAAFLGSTVVLRRAGVAVERSAWRNQVVLPAAEEPAHESLTWVTAIMWSLPVGGVFGLGAAAAFGWVGRRFVLAVVAFAVVYALVPIGLSLITGRLRRSSTVTFTVPSWLNALVSPGSVLLLALVSSTTSVKVLSTGATTHYSWFPWWVAGPLAVALALVTLRALVRARRAGTVREIEVRAVVLIAIPVAFFLTLASVPGALNAMDVFHDGEYLAAARLVAGGQFYWRDIVSIHGLLEDVWSGQIGWALFGQTRWGGLAGFTMVLNPLSVVGLYYLVAYLCWRRWLWIALFCVLALATAYVPVFPRFMMWPVALLILAWAMGSSSPARRVVTGSALACLLVFSAIVAPETSYGIVGAGLALIAADVRDWRRGASLGMNLLRSLSCLAAGALCAVVFVGFLAANRSIVAFIDYYRDFVPGHELSGALPWGGWGPITTTYVVEFSVSIAGLIAVIWYFAFRVYRGSRLNDRDLVAGAAAITAIVYFPKFFDRTDGGHLEQVYFVAFPVLLYLLLRFGFAIERYVRHGFWIHQSALAVCLLVAVLFAPLAQLRGVTDVASRYHQSVPTPAVSEVGYETTTAPSLDKMAGDVDWALRAYLRPGDSVFDFSNQPGLYYYLLKLNPRTQYYNVSMAETSASQLSLVSQLEANPPKIVVFDDQVDGLPYWDLITNPVRHYLVSRYILSHYHPLIDVDTQLLYVRNGQSGAPAHALGPAPRGATVMTQDMYFDRGSDWGSLPNFLGADQPPAGAGATPVTELGSTTDLALTGWAVDPSQLQPAWRVVGVQNGHPVGYADPDLRRSGSGSPQQVLYYQFSGFVLPLPGLTKQDLGSVRLYGLSYENRAGPIAGDVSTLGRQAGAAPARLTLPTRSEPVASGAVQGDVVAVTTLRTQTIASPSGAPWSQYRWLRVSLPARTTTEHISISDQTLDSPDLGTAPLHTISFDALPGPDRSFDIPVASNPQWYGYGSASLTVTSDGSLAAPELAVIR